MPWLLRTGLVFASVLALGLASRIARAQVGTTTTTTQASVAASQQRYPDRILNYGTSSAQDLGQSTRPQNLNPLGISYNDCITDQTLQFTVQVSGFTGAQNLQVWATRSGDCSTDTARGAGGAFVATCWLVNQGITGRAMATPQTVTLTVRVQDLVGPQNAPPNPPIQVKEGPSACLAQSTFVAVPMDIWFVPVLSNGLIGGTAYDYTIPGGTDLVGPPPPANVKTADGDTLSVVNWVANADSDTGGYNIYIDPLPGAASDANASGAAEEASLFCPETGPQQGAGASSDGATDAEPASDGATDAEPASDGATDAEPASDAAPVTMDGSATATDGQVTGATTSDAGCYPVNHGGGSAGSSGKCHSSILTSGVVQDSGTVVVETEASTVSEVGEAGGDATLTTTTTVNEGSGGISTIPCQYGIGDLCATSTTNVTVTGETTSTFTISGLTNGSDYSVVVASVDNFGNIGPPSIEACATPMPVNDFWKIYRTDGGQAGGGFCALEAVGAPASSSVAFAGAGAIALAGLRRRRRTRLR
jgi:hypothetical protein